jgi:hypothetical protein
MSETVESLTALGERLVLERKSLIELLVVNPAGGSLDTDTIRHLADLHTALQAVNVELQARLPKVGSGSET